MTDVYGGINLPATPGEFSKAAVDPALSAIGSYLQAVLTGKLGAAWATVAPGQKIVASVYNVRPQDALTKTSDFPALFLWRGPFTQTREGEDYLITRTQLGLLWLLWWDKPTKREIQLPFQGMVAKAIHSALTRGRDPLWIAAGDTNVDNATRGTPLFSTAGLYEPLRDMSGNETDITLDPEKSGNPVSYKALSLTIPIAERMRRDPALFSVPSISTSDPDNVNVDAGYPEAAALQLTVEQSEDNTIEQLQPLG
jgi:hypothetical protein